MSASHRTTGTASENESLVLLFVIPLLLSIATTAAGIISGAVVVVLLGVFVVPAVLVYGITPVLSAAVRRGRRPVRARHATPAPATRPDALVEEEPERLALAA
ncbi:MAG TPA: hypothetical protein VHX88_05085 [Solirubrobacteraceae bacterium]|nr:hypothetical protein [Solirubrobacteraceae bacterium]